jgi:hypothetical protein
VLAIVLAREHLGELHLVDGGRDAGDHAFGFLGRGLVAGLFGQVEQDERVVEAAALLLPIVGDGALLRLLFEQRLRLRLVVPELGSGGESVNLGDPLQRGVDVKDSLGANRARLRGS